jgi:hypothetical protein
MPNFIPLGSYFLLKLFQHDTFYGLKCDLFFNVVGTYLKNLIEKRL